MTETLFKDSFTPHVNTNVRGQRLDAAQNLRGPTADPRQGTTRPAPVKQQKVVLPSGAASVSVTATKTDSFADPDGDGRAQPGDTITCDLTVTNDGTTDATGVVFSDNLDANTSLVVGSVNTQPLAADDTY
ncbi:MAG: DUF11 domain-containing protein [Pyrinomonadaceae bacterium]